MFFVLDLITKLYQRFRMRSIPVYLVSITYEAIV